MTMTSVAMSFGLPVLSVGLLLALYRLCFGPSLADRIVSFDLIASCIIGILALLSIVRDQPVLLDIGIILAILSFLSTIGFAYYLEQRRKQ